MRGFSSHQPVSCIDLDTTLHSADRAKRLAEATNLSRRYVLLSSMLALIPFPLIDLAALLSLQVKLVHDLAKLYNVPFQTRIARPLLSSLLSGCAVTGGGVLLIAVGKSIPGLGTLVGGGLTGGLAGTTLATSEIFIRHFEAGGTLNDFVSPPTELFEKPVSANPINTEPTTKVKDQENLERKVLVPYVSKEIAEMSPADAANSMTVGHGTVPPLQRESALDKIYGMGPVYIGRLKSYGIDDLDTLVELEADKLREILGGRVSLATVNGFLSQARALIQEST
ncbi:MAG: DUF697 domain-containing protein [Cyanobacteriota bacterium]|nr:DUF697 domain-containing protein [Cyanobacteriota bacterium]